MTRMWMTDESKMCRQHLLGEHKEIHQLMGTLRKKMKVDGYVRNNCIEISSIISRHNTLVNEMQKRGYNHKSPIESEDEKNNLVQYLTPEIRNFKVDKESSQIEIFRRCQHCRDMCNK
jgi:uncharacterized membrane protein